MANQDQEENTEIGCLKLYIFRFVFQAEIIKMFRKIWQLLFLIFFFLSQNQLNDPYPFEFKG